MKGVFFRGDNVINKPIFIEIDKPIEIPIHSVQFDKNSRFINVYLLNNSLPLDVTRYTVTVAGVKPDGQEFFNECDKINSEEGLVRFEITEQMNVSTGIVNCEIKVYNDSEGVLTTKPFSIKVTRSLLKSDIESTGEFRALTEAISKVQGFDNKLVDLRNDTNEKFAQTNAQLSQMTPLEKYNNLQTQVNNLVLQEGNPESSSAEITQARASESTLNDRMNKIEEGKRLGIESIAPNRLKNQNADIIDYTNMVYNTRLRGYDTSTKEIVAEPLEGHSYTILQLPRFGELEIALHEVSGQSIIILDNSRKRIWNMTYSEIITGSHSFITNTSDISYTINVKQLTTVYPQAEYVALGFLMNSNKFVYGRNCFSLENDWQIDEYSLNSYPFNRNASFVKYKNNFTSVKNAVKHIEVYGAKKTDEIYFIRFNTTTSDLGVKTLTFSFSKTGFIYGTSQLICNLTGIEIKDELQELTIPTVNKSGIHIKMVVNTSEIDLNEIPKSPVRVDMDYETAGVSPICIKGALDYQIIRPYKFYAIQDKPQDLYLKNMTYGSIDDFYIRANGDVSAVCSFDRRKITINRSKAGLLTPTFYVEPTKGKSNEREELTFRFCVADKNSHQGETIKALFIGDSIIYDGKTTRELSNLFSTDVANLELIGTMGDGDNKHEGRAGWSTYDYLKTESFNNFTNVFLNPSTSTFDFSYYMTQTRQEAPDWVFIQLGINDIFRPMNATTTIDNINAMIESIKAYSSSIKIGVAQPLQPYMGEKTNTTNDRPSEYAHRFRLGITEDMYSEYVGKESNGIYLVPIYACIDTDYNFKMSTRVVNSRNQTTEEYCTDITHPSASGYYQIADQYYAFLKYN